MRKPDLVIGDNYLWRWHLIPRNPLFNVYLHKIMHSDDDRALHDHPYPNVSIVLRGGYLEITPTGCVWRLAGSVVFRRASALHRLELWPGKTAWSLFITGPRIRTWGFACPQGWRPWFEFVNPHDRGQPGRGCGE